MPKTPLMVAEELRVETSRVLKYDCHLKPNLTMEEAWVLKEPKEDKSMVILKVDKGMAMVVLDKQDYIN